MCLSPCEGVRVVSVPVTTKAFSKFQFVKKVLHCRIHETTKAKQNKKITLWMKGSTWQNKSLGTIWLNADMSRGVATVIISLSIRWQHTDGVSHQLCVAGYRGDFAGCPGNSWRCHHNVLVVIFLLNFWIKYRKHYNTIIQLCHYIAPSLHGNILNETCALISA